MLARAEELIGHLDRLEQEHYRLRGNLLSDGNTHDPRGELIHPSTIEGLLALACQRVACMVGDMATINGKVG